MQRVHRCGGVSGGLADGRSGGRSGGFSDGFTLIEVLVALTVVAITLGAGIKAAGALTGNTQRLSDVVVAQWCADNHLTGLKLTRTFPGIGDSEFACEQLGKNYRGKLAIRPTPNPNFRRIDVRMGDEDGQHILMLSTILGRF